MHVSVLGAGYVGLTTAVCLAHWGRTVSVFDASPDRAAALRAGRVPFHEDRIPDLLAEGLASGRLCVTESAPAALDGADLVLICVGTPLDADGIADLSQVESACRSIAASAPSVDVVIRSTLPLGETQRVAEWLGRTEMAGVVTNPEFLRQGSAVNDFLAPTRVIVGTSDGTTTQAAERLLSLYAGLDSPTVVTDFNSAEMIKNAANAFLATKLSFINEVADLCEAYGADVTAVVTGIGLDPRIGATYLNPGIGFGGSCLPKELANMVRLGRHRGLGIPLMAGAAQTNERRATRIVERLESLSGSLDGRRVAILGLAFKPGTDDLRYSPALALASRIRERGATVIGHDPVVPLGSTAEMVGLERAANPEEACAGADLVVLATEWPEYREMNWAALARQVRRPLVFDGRNILDARGLRAAGWTVIQVGRGHL